LKEVLEDGPVKVLHNSKFDYSFLHALPGISLSPIFDTMLAAQLLAGGDQSPSFSPGGGDRALHGPDAGQV
jgi:DNA polymerase-1